MSTLPYTQMNYSQNFHPTPLGDDSSLLFFLLLCLDHSKGLHHDFSWVYVFFSAAVNAWGSVEKQHINSAI